MLFSSGSSFIKIYLVFNVYLSFVQVNQKHYKLYGIDLKNFIDFWNWDLKVNYINFKYETFKFILKGFVLLFKDLLWWEINF